MEKNKPGRKNEDLTKYIYVRITEEMSNQIVEICVRKQKETGSYVTVSDLIRKLVTDAYDGSKPA